MNKKSVTGLAAALALGLVCMTSAQASVVSSTTNADFSNNVYTLNIASGAANYSFANGGADGFGGFNAALKTGGSALLHATNFGNISTFPTDSRAPFIDGTLLGQYKAFDSFTTANYSSVDTYLALAFNLDDGIHYGYARVDGTQFLGFGYETVAGMGIQAGAMGAATPVPEPGSLVMLAFGLALVGAGTVAARRRKI